MIEAAPELYFMRRLGALRRAQALTASMQFDLARSELDDAQLEEITDSFGGNASASGFGFSEIMRDSLSREPRKIPVSDLRTLQENLITQGYAPEGVQATGVWDPSWYAYFRRWDRDNYEAVVSGHHWGAAPLEAGIRTITNTLPSRVWQGLLGSAKGVLAQTPESAERLGLAGGALAGAAIGATLGSAVPVIGTAVGAGAGAVIGGIGGFLADLLGSAPGEQGQSGSAKLLDALSPYEEYIGTQDQGNGARAFWEDLGYVGTAASLVAGAGLAYKGVAGVAAGIRGTASTIEAAQATGASRMFVAGPTAAATSVESIGGGMSPTLRAALMRPPTVQTGIASKVIAAATRKFVPGSAGWLEQQMLRYGPFANFQRPAIQVVSKAFTGMSAAAMGGRLAAGFDLGTGAAGQTTIEKAIVETDPLQSGISLPLLGDLVDWAAFVMVPERFLPFRARSLGQAATRMMGDTMLRPYAHAFQNGTTMGLRRAADVAKEVVTPELNTYFRLDYGIHERTLELLRSTGMRGGYNTARAQVIRELKAEVEEVSTEAVQTLVPPPELAKTHVLDPSGQPLRVYHGSDVPFDEFTVETAQPGLLGKGLYFAEDPKIAETYSGIRKWSPDNPASKEDTLAWLRSELDVGGNDPALINKAIEDIESGAKPWRHFVAGGGAPNVHFSYLDIRNPFDASRQYTADELAALTRDLPAPAEGVRLGAEVELPNGDIGRLRPSKGEPGSFDVYTDQGFYETYTAEYLKPMLTDEPGSVIQNAIQNMQLYDMTLPGFKGGSQSVYGLLEQELGSKAAVNEFLRSQGYDGIFHIGAEDGRVWVAFDPKQVHMGSPLVRTSKNVLAVPGESPMVRDFLARSLERPEKFESWLIELGGKNRGPTIATNWAEASALARAAQRDVRDGRILVTETPSAFVASSQGLEIGGIRGQEFTELTLKKEAAQLETTIKRRTAAQARATDPMMVQRIGNEITKMRERLSVVSKRIEEGAVGGRQAGQINVIPARLDFLTRKDLFAKRQEYLSLVEDVKTTWAGELDSAHLVAREKLQRFVQDLAAEGTISDSLARRIVEAGADPSKVSKGVADALEEAAQTAARDVQLDPGQMQRFADLGYKPVVTGEDVIQLHEIDSIADTFGVGDYTRRAAVWETLGLSPKWTRDEDLFALRVAHERAELEQVFAETDVPLSGSQAITRLRDKVNEKNHAGVVIGPLVKPVKGRLHPYLVDVRQLSPDDILETFQDIAGFTDETARVVYAALKRGAAFGGEAKLLHPITAARSIGHALRISGLPGFADFIRTVKVPVTSKAMAALSGAAIGAATGAAIGDEPSDILRGALGGAAVGLGGRALAKRTYGYLPEKLMNMNMALRYTFSFTFDAGRYSEQNLIGAARYSLPPMLAPKRYMMSREWRSPYSDELVRGEEAWRHVIQFQDDLNGTKYFQHIDDTDRRLFQTGMLGYSPRNHEAARAFQLYQRGWSREKIREAVSSLERYGLGRSAAEKTANFIFFPFSFSKKLLSSLGDFMLQAPGRNLLLYEGLRRYNESSLDEGFSKLIEDHLPLLEQVWQINNLAFGISPGRFFLEGLDDHRTAVGKVAQVLASVFVPSGAATPLAQAAGGAADLAIHAFVPVVITGESLDRAGGIDGFDDILRRYIPMVREIDQYFVQGEGGKLVGGAVGEQVAAATSPGFRAPYAQLTGYLDEVRTFKGDLEPLALVMGYSSVEGLLASDVGAPMKARYEQLQEELRQRYPSGWSLVTQIDNTALIDEAAIADLARIQDPSPAEEAILHIAQRVTVLRTMNNDLGIPADIGGAMIASSVRQLAAQWRDDPRFNELYDRFYAREFGPMRMVA